MLLGQELRRLVAVCEEALAEYAGIDSDACRDGANLVLLAVAAFQTVIATTEGDPWHEARLAIAATLGRNGAAVIGCQGGVESLSRCAAACEEAARLCDSALCSN